MPVSASKNREIVGQAFSMDAMRAARDLTFEAVNKIAACIQPGMSEAEAHVLAGEVLERMGMQRIWHKIIVRFGPGTRETFDEPMEAERVLGANDIFFIDIGPVWGGHEGDAGDTFAVGDNPGHKACAEAARIIWREVAEYWRTEKATGEALYAFATARAEALGYGFRLDVKGHRVSDFPHSIYRAGDLGDFADCPASGLWILEIHLLHKTEPYGAFFEDLLVESL